MKRDAVRQTAALAVVGVEELQKERLLARARGGQQGVSVRGPVGTKRLGAPADRHEPLGDVGVGFGERRIARAVDDRREQGLEARAVDGSGGLLQAGGARAVELKGGVDVGPFQLPEIDDVRRGQGREEVAAPPATFDQTFAGQTGEGLPDRRMAVADLFGEVLDHQGFAPAEAAGGGQITDRLQGVAIGVSGEGLHPSHRFRDAPNTDRGAPSRIRVGGFETTGQGRPSSSARISSLTRKEVADAPQEVCGPEAGLWTGSATRVQVESMTPIRFADESHRQGLSAALKAVRRRRGRTAAEVAEVMGMPLRSYEHFEAGQGRFDFDKVRRFAEVLEADPFAILTAVQIAAPAFAARCADNKMMLALLIRLEEFQRELGETVADLDPALVLAELGEAFGRMDRELRRRARLEERPADYFP